MAQGRKLIKGEEERDEGPRKREGGREGGGKAE